MQTYKTISDINSLMGKIGCFTKTHIDEMKHKKYLSESLEDEDKYFRPRKTSDNGAVDNDNEFTRVESNNSYTILYNATPRNLLPSLLQNGPSVEFVGKGAGTYVWGKGVYTNYQMNQPYYRTLDHKSLYGTVLVKYRYNGNLMSDCLVAEKGLKRMGTLSSQIKRFDGLEVFLKNKGLDMNDLDNLTDGDDSASTQGLYKIVQACGGYTKVADVLLSFGVQGLVFYGHNDKPVAVIYNSDKLQVIGYMDNTDKTDVYADHETKWVTPKDGEGKVKDVNNINVITRYFKRFIGDSRILRAECGEVLLTDQHTNKQTFIDAKKAFEIIDNRGNEDPRLFGEFEFERANNFMSYGGKELAFVQIDKDPTSSFFIDKNGNLFKNKNDNRPISNIKEYYPDKDEPSNNDIDFDDDLDDGDDDIFKGLFNESIQDEARTETSDGHVELDNFDVARKIMDFTNSGNVYFIQLLERHKDHPDRHYEHNACDYKDWFEITCPEHFNAVEPVIKRLCQNGEWRAMLYINPRSMMDTREYANNALKKRFEKYNSHMKGHEVEVAYGQSKNGTDRAGKNWDKERPLCFVDVDNDDPKVHKQVLDYINKMGIQPLEMYNTTNNGLHIILPDSTKAKKLDFSFLDKGKDMGRWATAGLELDKSITLYAYVKPKGYGVQQRMQQKLSR